MPFGAQVNGTATTFRLWAPAAASVDLVLPDDATPQILPLPRDEAGWYRATLSGTGAGARYAYRIDGKLVVPDPASRANPEGVHAPSTIIDPTTYAWNDTAWRGRPWHEAVVYELHIGTFTPEGTFAGAISRLDELARLGVTAIELMPVAAFPGQRNWGYDGVLLYAPAACYGTPDDLKALVDAAHARGLMILLDVVYNHFGPDGNYLHTYAKQFFNPQQQTPWGAALNFDGEGSDVVRAFFIHNALYWLEEYHFDGLRLDAVHAIVDKSTETFLRELTSRVREYFAATRHVHIVLENDDNAAGLLARDAHGAPRFATAQWNDDLHHALHVIATGETDGYYADYADRPVTKFGRALAEGFIYQGEPSPYRDHAPRGERSHELPPEAFVSFAQNHDQVGNRALGERLVGLADAEALRALLACVLLSPHVPLLFMGEEFGASSPFLYFCDFEGDLAAAVTDGRRAEFARFARFHDSTARQAIPDPNARATFLASKLAWHEAGTGRGRHWKDFYRQCLAARLRHVTPLLPTLARCGSAQVTGTTLLQVTWTSTSDHALHLVANLAPEAAPALALPPGSTAFSTHGAGKPGGTVRLPAYAVEVITA
jgi:maltooligosyltrehalose trehalohydrolase